MTPLIFERSLSKLSENQKIVLFDPLNATERVSEPYIKRGWEVVVEHLSTATNLVPLIQCVKNFMVF